MKKYLIIILIVLPLGFGVGYFNNQYQEKKLNTYCPNGNHHIYQGWKASGKLYEGKMVSTRQCWNCKYIQSR
jgi:hypothetical protein